MGLTVPEWVTSLISYNFKSHHMALNHWLYPVMTKKWKIKKYQRHELKYEITNKTNTKQLQSLSTRYFKNLSGWKCKWMLNYSTWGSLLKSAYSFNISNIILVSFLNLPFLKLFKHPGCIFVISRDLHPGYNDVEELSYKGNIEGILLKIKLD